MYTRRYNMYPPGASSLTTSGAKLVADFGVMSIQVGASASTVTVQGSNADGLTSALAEADWSNISIMATGGVNKIEVGFRWLRTIRTNSANSVFIQAVQRD